MTFNLITTGSACEKVINFLKEDKDFENCIKHLCIFCFKIKEWAPLKEKYPIIYGIYNTRKEVIKFIETF